MVVHFPLGATSVASASFGGTSDSGSLLHPVSTTTKAPIKNKTLMI